MKSKKGMIRRIAAGSVLCLALYFVVGFLATPKINVQDHVSIGKLLWTKVVDYSEIEGRFPESEAELLDAGIFSREERRWFLDRNFGHRKFRYFVDNRLGPCMTLSHRPGTLYKITVWNQKQNSDSIEPPILDSSAAPSE